MSDLGLSTLVLPDREPGLQQELRHRIRRAVAREVAIKESREIFSDRLLYVPSTIITLAIAAGIVWAGVPFIVGLLAWSTYAFTLTNFALSRYGGFISPLVHLATFSILIPIAACWTFLSRPETVASYVGQLTWIPHVVYDRTTLKGIGGAGPLLTFFFVTVVASNVCDDLYESHIRKRQRSAGSYDRLILQWAETVAALLAAHPAWGTQKAAKSACQAIRDLASSAAEEFQLSWLFSQESKVRADCKAEALALSRHIHKLQKILLNSSSDSEFSAVVDELLDGLAHLTLGDRQSLMLHLEIVDVKERTRKNRAKAVAKHVFPGLVLAGAAIALPYVPGASGSGELANNLRITLIVMAALSLISAPDDVAKKVNDALAKALPTKRE
ncbi:hypothetical protein ACQSME_09385 [Streptomyces sp. 2-6]|uniref:hypothetical protein n=1 Tax=Streptomyces sp. 2-6 TaxID=2978333 RepID=UPI003D0CE8EC